MTCGSTTRRRPFLPIALPGRLEVGPQATWQLPMFEERVTFCPQGRTYTRFPRGHIFN